MGFGISKCHGGKSRETLRGVLGQKSGLGKQLRLTQRRALSIKGIASEGSGLVEK